MQTSESITKLAPALVAATAELRSVAKDAANPHFRSKYASLDAIMDAVRPVLARHGLAVLQGVVHPETDADGRLRGITVETRLIHASGEWVGNTVVMPVGKPDAQGSGGAITYGRRYGISALLAIATDDDDDGNAASAAPAKANAPRQAPPPAAGQRLHESVPTTPRTFKPMTLATAELVELKGQRLVDMSAERLESVARWADEKQNGRIAEACRVIAAARAAVDDDDAGEPEPVPF